MDKEKHPELQKVAEQIARGQRVVLFPPGGWSLIATIMLLIASTVACGASAISLLAGDFPPQKKAILQLLSLMGIALFVLFPALKVVHGNKLFKTAMVLYSGFLILFDCYLLLTQAGQHQLPIGISLVSALMAVALIQSTPFTLYSEFCSLIRNERKRMKDHVRTLKSNSRV